MTQNLIPNPSFEQNKGCPKSFLTYGQPWLIEKWKSPTCGTPDYYHECSKRIAGVPENWAGRTVAREGKAYAGIYLWV